MQKTTIQLKNLAFYARHGLLPEEAQLGQRFYVDVQVVLSPELDIAADSPEQTVNYVELYAELNRIFTGRRYNLIESCAHAVAQALLDTFDHINEVTVQVRKPSVPVDCVCDYFAAEVTLCR